MTTQAITTKYCAPTNARPARIKATCAAKSGYAIYDHGLNTEQNHRAAALQLKEAMGWPGLVVSGADAKGNYQHVILSADRAAPSPGTGHKYRPREVERVAKAMDDSLSTTLVIAGPDKTTRHLTVSQDDVAAILDLFNQNDAS